MSSTGIYVKQSTFQLSKLQFVGHFTISLDLIILSIAIYKNIIY